LTVWHEGDDDDEPDVVCLSCLVRPPRPGSVYCSRLCALLGRLRRLWAEAEAELARLPRPAGL
jgi:hypothetical protein